MFYVTMRHIVTKVLFLRPQLCYGYSYFISATQHTLLGIPEDQECIQIQVDTKKRTYKSLRERQRKQRLDQNWGVLNPRDSWRDDVWDESSDQTFWKWRNYKSSSSSGYPCWYSRRWSHLIVKFQVGNLMFFFSRGERTLVPRVYSYTSDISIPQVKST